MIFTSVSLLLLGQLNLFSTLQDAFTFLLGGVFETWYTKNSYNGGFYSPINPFTGAPATDKADIATYFMIIYMIVNYVLMLQLAVSILTVTYRKYYEYENGLYYNELITVMPQFQYDDKFGCISCVWTPMHIVFPFLIPIIEYVDIFYKEDIPYLNDLVCKFFYLPVALAIITVFIFSNFSFIILAIFI